MKHHPLTAHNEIKSATHDRSLKKIRSVLPPHLRIVSALIHWPPFEVFGMFIEKIIRPSFLTGGGISAFIASLILLDITQNHGYEFNYSIAIGALFAGGFGGIIAELLIRLFRNLR